MGDAHANYIQHPLRLPIGGALSFHPIFHARRNGESFTARQQRPARRGEVVAKWSRADRRRDFVRRVGIRAMTSFHIFKRITAHQMNHHAGQRVDGGNSYVYNLPSRFRVLSLSWLMLTLVCSKCLAASICETDAHAKFAVICAHVTRVVYCYPIG